ncbi:hypothetical protein SAMN06265795_103170 [Noviherbaspirillum humi]|uniref:Uncharacterized protein n=1 Tax=Noviherbaspirillum humi TaxID=1688639 RepID=A0A239F4J7_9BURK|nr:hypothetical protein [Noviherbaspirillum humi]SNS51651.1 hypothetical protein SAMN06265795_103170 [Noviherbaspirillum humi]
MKINRAKYYPVNLDTKEVLLAPQDDEQAVRDKYHGLTVRYLAIRGEKLLKHKCYQAFNYIEVKAA